MLKTFSKFSNNHDKQNFRLFLPILRGYIFFFLWLSFLKNSNKQVDCRFFKKEDCQRIFVKMFFKFFNNVQFFLKHNISRGFLRIFLKIFQYLQSWNQFSLFLYTVAAPLIAAAFNQKIFFGLLAAAFIQERLLIKKYFYSYSEVELKSINFINL